MGNENLRVLRKDQSRLVRRERTLVLDDWLVYPSLVASVEALHAAPGSRLQLGDWLQATGKPPGAAGTLTMEEVEKNHIIEVLELTDWRVSGQKGAAGILGLKPTTLEARMKKLDIERRSVEYRS